MEYLGWEITYSCRACAMSDGVVVHRVVAMHSFEANRVISNPYRMYCRMVKEGEYYINVELFKNLIESNEKIIIWHRALERGMSESEANLVAKETMIKMTNFASLGVKIWDNSK